ncbi:UbiA prenyltransferase family protein [Streptomyces sp. NPDC048337]|uniref:UbiA prenyltransferase family protein n=1 Tax=Streptomyces sp. NPDC048337 TaxID=3365535 RepID=UPI003713B64E
MSLVIPQVKALYALSRGTQATLSVAQPLVAVLLATDRPPPLRLAMVTAFALTGFFAVFAANDLFDAPLDRAREPDHQDGVRDIDSIGGLHPLARGRLRHRHALAWVLGLSTFALVLGMLLSLIAAALFVTAALLQVLYCKLATVTAAKTLVSGVMVAVGTSAGWFVSTPVVDLVPLGLFALWMAAWEIGGRNIPNDLADVVEDARMGIRTVPVAFGPLRSAQTACVFLTITAVASISLAVTSWTSFGPIGLVGTVLTAGLTLLIPARRLIQNPTPPTALAVFNITSLHPACVLAAFVTGLVTR